MRVAHSATRVVARKLCEDTLELMLELVPSPHHAEVCAEFQQVPDFKHAPTSQQWLTAFRSPMPLFPLGGFVPKLAKDRWHDSGKGGGGKPAGPRQGRQPSALKQQQAPSLTGDSGIQPSPTKLAHRTLQAWDGWLAQQRESWLSDFSSSRVDLIEDLSDEDEDTGNGGRRCLVGISNLLGAGVIENDELVLEEEPALIEDLADDDWSP